MKPLCSRTQLYLFLPRNPNSQHLPRAPLFLQVSHFSTQSSNFHSRPVISHSSRRYEDKARNVQVSVWWDFENCSIPAGVNVFRVAQTITAVVRANGMKGPVQITAFGDVLQLSRANQKALSSTGINLTHIPNGGKNSADRSLLVDLLYWVSRNPPPAHLFLISGDRDFAGILHRLRMNNYNILLASRETGPRVLCSAASIMWDWNSMIRGEELIGKLYNQPPDGPYGSWYGHYNAPLVDPFAVPEQSPPVKNEEMLTSEPGSELKVHPVPEMVMRRIYKTLKENPKGISITKLREELKRGNLILDNDFFGHKKFTQFLSSMPHILKLNFLHDGLYMVKLATAKLTEPCDSIGDLSSGPTVECGEVDQRTNPKLKVESGERSFSKDERAKPESRIIAEGSSEKANEQKPTVQKGGKLSQTVSVPPPLLKKKAFEGVNTQASEDNLSKVSQQDSEPQVGFFSMIWRWFGGIGNDDSDKKIESYDNSTDHSIERKEKEEAVKMVSNDIDRVNSESSSLPSKEMSIKEQASDDSERIGFFRRIVNWCTFQGNTSEPEPMVDQSNEEAVNERSNHLGKDPIFSQEDFWSDVKSFLNSPRGSNIVSQSRTRGALAKNMRKAGPAVLGALSETDLLHLVNLLISEKKLVEEDTSQLFPFRLSQPNAQGSKCLRSIFSDKPSENVGERKIQNISHTGISSPIPCKKPPTDRSRILADVQTLVQEVLVQFPEGYKIASFRKLFLDKYGYPLDLQKLDYHKLMALVQVIPGVSLESGQIVPSNRARQGPSPYPGATTQPQCATDSDRESSDPWDELCPLAKESPGGRNKQFEYEPVLLNEEESTSGSEDDLSSAGQAGGRYKKRKSGDEESSLMQVLDIWYSKEGKGSNTKAWNSEQADDPELPSNSSELSELRHKQKRVYSFTVDKNGGDEREKQIESMISIMPKTTMRE